MEYKIGDLKIIISSEGQTRIIENENEIYVGFPEGLRFNVLLKALLLAKDIHNLNSWTSNDVSSEKAE